MYMKIFPARVLPVFIVVAILLSCAFPPARLAAQDDLPVSWAGVVAPADCATEAPSVEALASILGNATVGPDEAIAAFGTTTYPDGEPLSSETLAEIAPVVRAFFACLDSGDIGRAFALMADSLIEQLLVVNEVTPETLPEFLAPIATDPGAEGTFIGGIFHGRLLADGQVVVIAPSWSSYPSVLWLAHADRGWLVQRMAAPEEVPTNSGILGNTYSSVDSNSSVATSDRTGTVYWGYGVEWPDPWTVSEPNPIMLLNEPGAFGDLELTNGTGFLLFDAGPWEDSTAQPDCSRGEPALALEYFESLLNDLGLVGVTDSSGALALSMATGPAGQFIAGQDASHAWVAYDIPITSGGERFAVSGTEPRPLRFWFDCRLITSGTAQLVVLHVSPVDRADTEDPAREAVLATIQG